MTADHQQARDAAAVLAFPNWGHSTLQLVPRRPAFLAPPVHEEPVERYTLAECARELRVCPPEPDEHWVERAECVGLDPDLFFPDKGEDSTTQHARSVCAVCPVRVHCLQRALEDNEKHGVWGGMATRERYAAKARIRQRRAELR